jgi:iron complex transport system permease protein
VSELARRATPARTVAMTLAAAAILVAAIAGALAIGVESIDLHRAFADPSSPDGVILFSTRLSRVLLGAIIGAALAPAGVAFQALLRNPLAEPYVLGVSGGASVAGTLALVLGGGGVFGTWTLPLWAFCGAVISVAAVYTMGRVRGRLVPNVALLAGVVWNALSAALIVAIRLCARPEAAHDALYWLSGSLGPIEGMRLASLCTWVVIGLGVLLFQAAPMNAFALGDDAAHSVGVDVEGSRRTIFLAASLLTGAAVAFAGPIGFVGIIVPHVLRGWLGPDHRMLLPVSALIGAAFLVLADTGARITSRLIGTEPTVGVLTALLGVPFFLVVLRARGGERAF